MDMKRRKFVHLATVSTAIAVLPIGCYNSHDKEYIKSLAYPHSLSSIWPEETIAEIGKLYQKQHPQERSESDLVELLSESISTRKDSLAAKLEWRIKEDFNTGKIITVDGWIISATEGRQCALFSLINKN